MQNPLRAPPLQHAELRQVSQGQLAFQASVVPAALVSEVPLFSQSTWPDTSTVEHALATLGAPSKLNEYEIVGVLTVTESR